MVFFPAIVAPSVFKVLNEKNAGKLLRFFFPRYYIFGIFLSFFGLLSALYENSVLLIYSFMFLFVTFLFSKQILTPAINNARDRNQIKRFEILHRCSVIINFIQILVCFVLILNSTIFQYEF